MGYVFAECCEDSSLDGALRGNVSGKPDLKKKPFWQIFRKFC